MRLHPSTVNAASVFAASAVLLACGTAEAQTIIPVDQDRHVSNEQVNAPQCSDDVLFDNEAAAGFEPFDAFVRTQQGCDFGFAGATAGQQSQIDSASMTASGTAMSEALGPVPGHAHAFGISRFVVTFELPSLSRFDLDGTMTAGSLPVANVGAIVLARLWEGQIGDVLLFQQSIEAPPGGGTNKEALEAAGALEPGVYTLDVQAGSFIEGLEVPPSRSGQASFSFTFDVRVLADLTGPRGVPDGCVVASYLVAMLGAWCSAVNDPNPPSPPCENCTQANLDLADIAGPSGGPPDGCVDSNDLLELLGDWCSVVGGNPCGTCSP